MSGSDQPSARVRIVIVDDHVFVRDLMTRMFRRERNRYDVVCAVGTSAEAIQACMEFHPDLLILDINLPDRSGVAALPDIKRVAPETRVLLCTAYRMEDSFSALAGTTADGFVEKTDKWSEFVSAVNRVARGERYFCSHPPSAASTDNHASHGASRNAELTPREAEIIALIARGLTSKEIAAQLYISPATVETHRTNLMAKLHVRNVAGLVTYALRHNLVPKIQKPA